MQTSLVVLGAIGTLGLIALVFLALLILIGHIRDKKRDKKTRRRGKREDGTLRIDLDDSPALTLSLDVGLDVLVQRKTIRLRVEVAEPDIPQKLHGI